MGEAEGEGMLIRWELIDGEVGVAGGDELVESEDADETERERGLFRAAMGMGSEWVNLIDFSFADILCCEETGEEWSKAGFISDFIVRSLANSIIPRDMDEPF